ncbi:two-component system sensor histidine kinase BaeS [Lipingzhangella halophila]|uniref:histidine kinase n=1 Tax=Lipingzhangella halophila TaxID=1783352 RepID=A0A7W7RCQ6_9ACTN|nr:HAMP domain-containing sensor histidine kinase [Lipingzhangella halophila]MBB4929605.1 two-component system sensor histidine kinase BaeS [Lipingzhangella halophila]
MRRSLLLRLLGLSLAVASFGIVATALLATYSTGSQLRDELESTPSLLETDSGIRSTLLRYALENDGWDGAGPLVRDLAEETGRRITLTTPDGEPIIDSAELLGQAAGDRPANPAARIDAAAQKGTGELTVATQRSGSTSGISANTALGSYSWQMTEQEKAERQALADEAVECLEREGIDATIDVRGGSQLLLSTSSTGGNGAGLPDPESPSVESCVPEDLNAPSVAARDLNERTVELTTACLDDEGLAHEVSRDSHGMSVVRPPADGNGQDEPSRVWKRCEDTARATAMEPYVAPAADLYLGSSERFAPLSPEGWSRTAVTTAVILLVAAAVTVLAGRRLLRPILALTAAAQRMESGDREARVPVASGNDEVARLAEAFNAMAESIENSDRQKKALVSDVAHELRTPLANVRGSLEAAEVGVLPLDTALVQSLLEESTLLERLVCDLQDLALADAGMLRVNPEERDAADLAGQAVAAHRTRAETAEVDLRLDVPETAPVHADPARLRQALGNLVSNAVTHTPPGGSVEVAVCHTDEWATLTVTDSGPGIDPEHLPHVFDRFYRADPSRSRSTGGSGLGLAITKHLVEAHGGTVDATSTPGEGSVFRIRLPRAEPE